MINDKVSIVELKKILSPLSLLYVEDNPTLQEKASVFFEKFFGTIYKANDGQEGLNLFKKHHPDIVVTDIHMPHMNGLEMAQTLRQIDSKVKIIITSAADDKKYLLKAIELGIDGYLIKPLKVKELAALLYTLTAQMSEDRNKQVFSKYMRSIFNNQTNLLLMTQNNNVLLANEHTLKFFETDSLKEFKEKVKSFDSVFAPHDSFLYQEANSSTSCLDYAKENCEKLHNVKIIDKDGLPHHFVLKMTHIEDDGDFYILSLTDITQLNLLSLYDQKSLDHDKALHDKKTIYNLLEGARESAAVIKLYNFYKGLMICNNGLISRVGEESFTCKSTLAQQKAARYEGKIIINCELFPYDLQSLEIKNLDFRFQTIEVAQCKMLKTTPVVRKSLVLEPHSSHSITLFYNKHPFRTHIEVINISIDSIRFFMEYLPAGFKENDEMTLNIVFSDTKKPFIINSQAFVSKIIPAEKSFHIVANFALNPSMKQTLTDYIASRQMQLIREFKDLQI